MSVTVKLRLPVPEGKPGAVVTLSDERAAILVDRRYATYVSSEPGVPVADMTPAAEPIEPPDPVAAAPAPSTELPNHSDRKEEWVAVAEALGIDLQREDGSDKTKDELIAEVEEATGTTE